MKSTEAEICFPILTFTVDNEVGLIETLDVLTRCGPRTLKNGAQVGMEIVDADLRRWVVKSVRKVGRDTSFVRWLIFALLSTPGYRVDQELEPLAPLSVEEMRRRVCSVIEAHPEDWCNDDEIETVLAPLLAEIMAASSVSDIHRALGLDDFRSH